MNHYGSVMRGSKVFFAAVFGALIALFLGSCVTDIYTSAKIGDTKAIEAFLEENPDFDINRPDYQKDSALMKAVLAKKTAAAAFLIEKGADINYQRPDSHTPLRAAINNNDARTLAMLIEKGADVNISNKYGWTPLMSAAKVGSLALVKMLISAGADVYAVTEAGYTAASYALQENQAHIYEFLSRLMTDEEKAQQAAAKVEERRAAQGGPSARAQNAQSQKKTSTKTDAVFE